MFSTVQDVAITKSHDKGLCPSYCKYKPLPQVGKNTEGNFVRFSTVISILGPVSGKSWWLFRPGKLFKVCHFYIQDQCFKKFVNDTMKLPVIKTKLTGLWAKNHATVQQVFVWIFDFGPNKLPELLRGKPQEAKSLVHCLYNQPWLHPKQSWFFHLLIITRFFPCLFFFWCLCCRRCGFFLYHFSTFLFHQKNRSLIINLIHYMSKDNKKIAEQTKVKPQT